MADGTARSSGGGNHEESLKPFGGVCFEMYRCQDAKRHGLLSLNLRNILISPLEGEKKFLGELNELSNKGRLGILPQREAGFEPSPAFVMLTGVRKRLLPLTKREGSDSVISFDFKSKNTTTHENNLSCKDLSYFGRSALLCRQGRELSALVPQYLSNFPDTVFSRFTSHFSHKRTAFTIAEVLITIGIIGVVAALTIPAIIANTQGKEYEVARKRMLQTFGEGVRLISIQGEMQSANNAEDFVENYLKKQIKIMKTCDNDNLKACGIETGTNAIKAWSDKKITRTMPRTTSQLNSGIASGHTMKNPTKSYGFVMANGYAVNLFYNPNCEAKKLLSGFANWTSDFVCVNAIYDMNGLKGPNQAGKDIGFVTILYPDTSSIALAPNPYYKNLKNANYKDGMAGCAELGADYTLPRLEEWASISYNRELFDFDYGGSYWLVPGTGFSVSSWGGYISAYGQNNTFNIRCVKR